jgi:PAS domain S-box-containing protein
MSEGGPTLEDRLDNLAERINDIAIRVTREGVVEHITRNACQRLGVEQEEVIGRNLSELLHPDDRQQTLSQLWESAEQPDGARAEARLQRADGSWLRADVTGIAHVDSCGEKAVLIVGRDLSERAREEATPHAGDAQLRLLADTVPAMLWMTSADGHMLNVNRAATEFLGIDPADVSTDDMLSFYHHIEDQEKVRARLVAAIDRRDPFSVLARVRNAEGEYRRLLLRGKPRFAADGEFLGLVGAAFDMTEIMVAKASQHRSERLATIGTLATGIAREIDNPLAAIRSAAEGAITSLDRVPNFRCMEQSLKRILVQVDRASKISRNLLHFAQSEPSEREIRDLNALVMEMVDQLRGNIRAAQASVECQLDPNLPHIPLTWTEMVYVITNLLQNAVESSERPVHVSVRTERRGEQVLLTISDDGDGIPEDLLTRIFDPFFTTRRHGGGTGLGLSLVQRIMRDHEGTIEVQSTLDRGTSFILSLPTEPA